MVAHGAIGVVGRVGFLGRHIEARKQANGLVEVKVVDVAAPFFVQQLQDEQAQQRTGRGHHRGARIAGLADQVLEVYTGQQGQEEKHPRDARRRRPGARLKARTSATTVVSGTAGRGLRLPLGSPQGRLHKKGTSPACTWARNRQTIERNEVSR